MRKEFSLRQKIAGAIGAAAIIGITTFGSGCAENPKNVEPKTTLINPSGKEISDQEILEIMDSYEKQGDQPIILDTWTASGGTLASDSVTPGTSKNYRSPLIIVDSLSQSSAFYSPVEGVLKGINGNNLRIKSKNGFYYDISWAFGESFSPPSSLVNNKEGQIIRLGESLFNYARPLRTSIQAVKVDRYGEIKVYEQVKVIDLKKPPLFADIITPTPTPTRRPLTQEQIDRWSISANSGFWGIFSK